MSAPLRIVVATPLRPDLVDKLVAVSPLVEIVVRPDLLPPQRWAGDHGGDPAFVRTPQQQAEFEELLVSADVWYGIPAGSAELTGRLVPRSPQLRWIHTMAAGGGSTIKAAGLSPEDLERVVVTTSAGVHGTALAEFALFGVLAAAKDLPVLLERKERHHWDADRWIMRQVRDQTVLVIGLGGIGTETARLFKALGSTVLGVRRNPRPTEHVDEVHDTSALLDLLPRADAVVVTLPATAATENLLDAAAFAAMKPGTVLVNVGRGTVVDEQALVDALHAGQVRGAYLDVTAQEPLPASSPLWDEPAVFIAPHVAALQADEDDRIADLFADNLRRLLDSRDQRNVVNTTEFY